jgi:hypothetical protein
MVEVVGRPAFRSENMGVNVPRSGAERFRQGDLVLGVVDGCQIVQGLGEAQVSRPELRCFLDGCLVLFLAFGKAVVLECRVARISVAHPRRAVAASGARPEDQAQSAHDSRIHSRAASVYRVSTRLQFTLSVGQ